MLSGLFQASRAEDLTESPAGLQKKTTEPAFNHDKLCLSTTAPDKSDLLVERRRSPDQSRPRCLLLLHLRLCCCGGSGPIPLSALTSVPYTPEIQTSIPGGECEILWYLFWCCATATLRGETNMSAETTKLKRAAQSRATIMGVLYHVQG